jgi:hypothetical protein
VANTRIAVQSVLPTVIAAGGVGGTNSQTGAAIGLPPPSARGYGKQPAHVEDYDPVQFEKAVQRLNQANYPFATAGSCQEPVSEINSFDSVGPQVRGSYW